MIFDFIKNLFGKSKQKLSLPDAPELEDLPDAEAPGLEELPNTEPPELEEAESPESPKLDEFGESTEPPEFAEEALSSALDGLTEADLEVPVPETADWIERDTNVAVSPNMAAFDGPGGGSFTAPDKEEDAEIVFVGSSGTADTPETILPAAFETEAAQADTWDRDNQDSGEDGVNVRVVMRVVYDDASDEKLYAHYRTFKFDSEGALMTISAETRVTVDTPGLCTE